MGPACEHIFPLPGPHKLCSWTYLERSVPRSLCLLSTLFLTVSRGTLWRHSLLPACPSSVHMAAPSSRLSGQPLGVVLHSFPPFSSSSTPFLLYLYLPVSLASDPLPPPALWSPGSGHHHLLLATPSPPAPALPPPPQPIFGQTIQLKYKPDPVSMTLTSLRGKADLHSGPQA